MLMETHPFHTFFYVFIFLSIFLESSIASDSITPTQLISDGETLVSSGQRFELGFFSPGNSKNRYLGIWHKNIPSTVLWVANRNSPITGSSGVLHISNDGKLVLLNETEGVVWSSNSSTRAAENTVAKLLDSGNLVLIDKSSMSSESYIWQSFDYPTDTRLPGLKIGRDSNDGIDRYLTSWKSANDPSQGDYTYRMDYRGLSQLVIEMGSVRKYRTGPWNGLRFSGLPTFSYRALTPIFTFNRGKLYNTYEPYNSSFTTRLTLNSTGLVLRYITNEMSTEWTLMHTVPTEPCDRYGLCGANGFCKANKSPFCECLKGFAPKLQHKWELLDWSGGCIRNVPLDCQGGDRFLRLVGVKLPDLLEFWLNNTMSLKDCEAECLNNCSCTAYSNANISGGGSGCLIWFGDLIDIREFNQEDSQQDIYIRLQASELQLSSSVNAKKRQVTVISVSIISGLLILGLLFLCLIWRKRIKTTDAAGEDLLSFDFNISPRTAKYGLIDKNMAGRGRKKEVELPLFSFSSVSAATGNFSATNKLGEGGFGPVYKGSLLKGQLVAAKRLSKKSGQGWEELENEAMLIAKLQHKNLVKLLGCCIERDEKILIYEYLPNKSLDFSLFDPIRHVIIDWATRVHIIEGIAQGLLYLHQYSRVQIIHRDLKTSNILLDKDMNPKISDFGMARIFLGNGSQATNRIVGTYGYMSPEYALEGIFSTKSDVFSFGVLLLEILSGKKNTGFYHSDSLNLIGYAWDLWKSNRAFDLKDPVLEDVPLATVLLKYINIALLCVQETAADRPTMFDVVSMFSNEHALVLSPKQPAFSNVRGMENPNVPKTSPEIYSLNEMTHSILEAR